MNTRSAQLSEFMSSRLIFSGGVAGVISGILFIGIGSRLAMRIVAMLNPDLTGALTDSEAVVGQITRDGSVTIIVFTGLLGGALAGGIWIVIRGGLPRSRPVQILLTGILATLMGSFMVIEASNIDFKLFKHVELSIVMFMFLIGACGAAIPPIDELVKKSLPTGRKMTIAYRVLAVFGIFVAVNIAMGAYFSNGAFVTNPPILSGVFLLVATTGLLIAFMERSSKFRRIPINAGWTMWALGMAGTLIFGSIHLVGELSELI